MTDRTTPVLSGKSASAARMSLAVMMGPEHANIQGNVHGGWIMKLVDEAGALTCMRHAQRRVVTVAIDQMTFKEPIRIGDLVTLTAEVSYVGHTSMEAEVLVTAENPVTGECTHTNAAFLVYVALDDDGHPTQVPPLLLENDAQRLRFEEGKARQAYRLASAKNRQDR